MIGLVVFLLSTFAIFEGSSQVVPSYSYSYSTVVQHGVPYPIKSLAGYTLATPEVVVLQPSADPSISQKSVVAVKNISKETEENTTTENSRDVETTTEADSENIRPNEGPQNETNQKEKLTQDSQARIADSQGVYYIYHPVNGVLQKVVYSAKNDEKEMALVAQLKYQNVEPIKEPIYTYDPETFALQPLKLQ